MKIPMQKIEITRGEGPYEGLYGVGKTFNCYTWDAANRVLMGIAMDKKRDPHDGGGYDKADFVITFEDGFRYDGRADVTADGDDTDLARHVWQHNAFHAGEYCPPHMTQERYASALESFKDHIEGCKEFLAKYNIPYGF